MQSSKIDFLSKYNEILNLAVNSSADFPSKLCEFLTTEFELDAAVLFKVNNSSGFEAIGKSTGVKKSIIIGSTHSCQNCQILNGKALVDSFNQQNDCAVHITDHLINEGCLLLSLGDNTKALLKIAKKTSFTKSEIDNIHTVAESFKNLLKLWIQGRGSLSNSLSLILSSISQELRTPTNSIMGFASLLNEENLSPSQAEYVSTLKDNAFELLSLINDLIDISKLESGLAKPNLNSIRLKDFINELLSIFKDKADNSNVEFITEIDEVIPETIKVDAQKLRYILLTFLTNSLRLIEKGKITLSVTASSNKKISFRISDTSTGLPSKKVTEFFYPFSLSELYNSKVGNITGLSLTLSKKYIEFLGGDVIITSSIGKGITYNFSINAELATSFETGFSAIPKPTDKKNKVLVVEDDYATSKLLSNYLTKWGYEPIIVNSAKQALKLIEHESYLAVLMDIILPDMNGFEFMKMVREHPNSKHTPVIICSVEAEQQKAFMMGAVEYFVKPINYKYLVEVLTSYKLKKDSNILVVDDDIPTLNLIKGAVEQAGFNAIAEHQSSKVVNMIDNLDLDLAIIDLDMPVLNGFELIKQIKSKKQFAKLPIIIYTGKDSYQEDLKKIDGLFTELLHKSSTNIENLADTVAAMINRYDEPAAPETIKDKSDSVKILLVEDYKHSQIIVTRLLKKNNFDSIVVVENGLQALEAVKQQKYDLILMDMQMPVMNGFEATQKIRELDDYRDTPIIALTAFAMKGDREKCLEAGATDYIPKPIDSQEFIDKVKYYTEKNVPKV